MLVCLESEWSSRRHSFAFRPPHAGHPLRRDRNDGISFLGDMPGGRLVCSAEPTPFSVALKGCFSCSQPCCKICASFFYLWWSPFSTQILAGADVGRVAFTGLVIQLPGCPSESNWGFGKRPPWSFLHLSSDTCDAVRVLNVQAARCHLGGVPLPMTKARLDHTPL